MAQLKDDCFAGPGELIPLETALDDLSERLNVVAGTHTVALVDALSLFLAEDIIAGRNVPPRDNSAVDGYAVNFDDLAPDGETRMAVGGRIAAGHPLQGAAERGLAYRIFTGAPMPDGFDTIFMQEDVQIDGDHVVLPPGLKAGSNRRFKGEDITAGAVVVAAGRRLRPQDLGVIASVGIDHVLAYKPLRAAVFSTGDEIRDPAGEAPDGCVFDANRFTVIALLQAQGCIVDDLGILPDDEAQIGAALATAAASHDLIFTSGGVSVGDEDHVRAAVEAHGTIHFWRLAIKPGRPVALGQIGDAVFVGLPGNPVATMVTFLRVALPVVVLLAGGRDITPAFYRVATAFTYKKKTGRREWVRCRLIPGDDGVLRAEKYQSGGAGVLSSMVWAHGLVELDEDSTQIKEGEMVNFLPFSEVNI